MDSLFTKGNNYAGIKANELINPFWKDLLISWNNSCKAVRIETLEDIFYCPIWFNSNMDEGQNLYFKEWHDKGIKNVIDLLNGDRNFYQFDKLKENYGIHGCKNLKQYVARNCYLKLLCKDKKGSRTFLAHLNNVQGELLYYPWRRGRRQRQHPQMSKFSLKILRPHDFLTLSPI